jgi:hypothetical protein
MDFALYRRSTATTDYRVAMSRGRVSGMMRGITKMLRGDEAWKP